MKIVKHIKQQSTPFELKIWVYMYIISAKQAGLCDGVASIEQNGASASRSAKVYVCNSYRATDIFGGLRA